MKYPCDFCGKMIDSWEGIETGWPNNIQHWCLYPDHRPMSKRYPYDLIRYLYDLLRMLGRKSQRLFQQSPK